MRLIDLDAIMAQFLKADFDGDAIENMKAYPHWKTDITGLINILKSVPVIKYCKDAISREMAVRELDKYLCGVVFEEGIDEVIKKLPPVLPQTKRGKWIENDYFSTSHCSVCDIRILTAQNWFKFCPNCGADMRESDKNE